MKLSRSLIRPILAVAGAVLLALCSLASNLKLFDNWIEFSLAFVGSDHVTEFEKQFDAVKTVVPRQGVAGFVTDQPADVEWYYKAQYSLAPLLLERDKSHEFVMMLEHYASARTGPKTNEPYTVVDLGHGISLYYFGHGIKVYHNEKK